MIKVLKFFTGLGGFIILAIGLIMLGATIWAFTQAAFSFNDYTFLGIVLGADFVIIFGSVIGICGIKRQNGAMICIFQVLVMIFFFVFLGVGISAQVLPKTVFNQSCNNSTVSLVQLAHNASRNASLLLCTPFCPCGLSNDSIYDKNKWNSTIDIARLEGLTKSTNGPFNFQGCDVAKNFDQDAQNMYYILQSVQYALDCSGWCQNENALLYHFSDVNRGKPANTCFIQMKNKLYYYGDILAMFAFISAAFLMLVCLCGLCICCAAEQRKQPFASRFVTNNGGYYHVN